jgi:hypothetical protein
MIKKLKDIICKLFNIKRCKCNEDDDNIIGER